MSIKAVNKKWQSTVNKAYKYYREYHRLVNLDDSFELYSKALEKHEHQQELVYDKYVCYMQELPKREQTNFTKMHIAIHGYG